MTTSHFHSLYYCLGGSADFYIHFSLIIFIDKCHFVLNIQCAYNFYVQLQKPIAIHQYPNACFN